MPKYTVLEMTQSILSSMDSDNVNSIDDTPEALQVAQIIKDTFYSQMSTRNWPHTERLSTLSRTGLGLDKPTHLLLPDTLTELTWLRYDVSKEADVQGEYREIKYMTPEQFVDRLKDRRYVNANIEQVIDIGGTILLIRNDTEPKYWTSFDDEYIVLDSYDSEFDDTVKESKTQALYYAEPSFELLDDSIPDIPIDAFSGLLEEARARSTYALKKEINPHAEREAVRQRRWLSRKAWKAAGGVRYPDYGRSSNKYRGTERKNWKFGRQS